MLNGYGLGEVHHGGYAKRARVKGDWLSLLLRPFLPQCHGDGHRRLHGYALHAGFGKRRLTPDKGNVLVTGADSGWGQLRSR